MKRKKKFKKGDRVIVRGFLDEFEGIVERVRKDGYLDIKYPHLEGTDREWGVIHPDEIVRVFGDRKKGGVR